MSFMVTECSKYEWHVAFGNRRLEFNRDTDRTFVLDRNEHSILPFIQTFVQYIIYKMHHLSYQTSHIVYDIRYLGRLHSVQCGFSEGHLAFFYEIERKRLTMSMCIWNLVQSSIHLRERARAQSCARSFYTNVIERWMDISLIEYPASCHSLGMNTNHLHKYFAA